MDKNDSRQVLDKDGIPHRFCPLTLAEGIELEKRLGGPLQLVGGLMDWAAGLWILSHALDRPEADVLPLFDLPSAARAVAKILETTHKPEPKKAGSLDDHL